MFQWVSLHGSNPEPRMSAGGSWTSEQIAAFSFYRWWTIPFDIFCMIVLIFAILYTFACDIADARTGGEQRGHE